MCNKLFCRSQNTLNLLPKLSYSKNNAKLPLEQYIFHGFGCSQEILFVLQACLPVRSDLDGGDSYVFPVSLVVDRRLQLWTRSHCIRLRKR